MYALTYLYPYLHVASLPYLSILKVINSLTVQSYQNALANLWNVSTQQSCHSGMVRFTPKHIFTLAFCCLRHLVIPDIYNFLT